MRILERKFVQDFINMANEGYQQGWHERNGGNLSYRLTQHNVEAVSDRLLDHAEWHNIGASVPGLGRRIFPRDRHGQVLPQHHRRSGGLHRADRDR